MFFSDGINTSGAGLQLAESTTRSAALPVYAILAGSDATPPDLKLVDLLLDQEVYFGDQVSVEVSVVASEIPSANANVALIDRNTNQVLDQTQLRLNRDKTQAIARLRFVPEKPGAIPLAVQVAPVKGEIDTSNNRLEAAVNVQDKTLKVLLIQDSPDFEFRFLKHFLERSKQVGDQQTASFELQCVLQSADPEYVKQDESAIRLVPSSSEKLAAYDVFVFGELNPSLLSRRSQELIRSAIVDSGAGVIFFCGDGDYLSRLQGWPLADLLPAQPPSFKDTPATRQFRWSPTNLGQNALPLQLSATDSKNKQVWQALPSFSSIASVGPLKLGSNVWVETNDDTVTEPLLITQYAGAGRFALQCTDETFLWTSFQGSDTYHQRYWGQMLRWLSRGKLNKSAEASTITAEPKQATSRGKSRP